MQGLQYIFIHLSIRKVFLSAVRKGEAGDKHFNTCNIIIRSVLCKKGDNVGMGMD